MHHQLRTHRNFGTLDVVDKGLLGSLTIAHAQNHADDPIPFALLYQKAAKKDKLRTPAPTHFFARFGALLAGAGTQVR